MSTTHFISEMPAKTHPWWQTAVFYQIYPRSFKDSTGNGVGDLRGIIEKLDYLQELGIDAIWLNPIYPSPLADFGYDITDYVEIDPHFGDLDTFDRLLAEAHARNMRVVLDYVPNHTSDQHPWFVESKSSIDSSKRDWYIWRLPEDDGGPPNNWLSNFGGGAWTLDETTGQYYLHSFLPEQPDLNLRNPELRAVMLDVIRFWLDREVDGFRIDAAMHLFKDPQFRDNPEQKRPTIGKDRGDVGEQVQFFNANQPDTHAFLRDLRRLIESYPGDRLMLGEVYLLDPAAAAHYYGDNDEFHLVPNFSLVNLPWEVPHLRASIDAYEQALPANAHPAHMFGSHDERRLASRFGSEAARCAAVMLLTLRGSPILYFGDELGMTDVLIGEHEQQDPWGIRTGLPHLSRDPARAPMLWSTEESAGFSPTESERPPWLPVHTDFQELNVETLLAQPRSILNLYRRLIELRRQSSSLTLGTYRSLDTDRDALYAYLREDDVSSTLIVLNFDSSAAIYSHSVPRTGHILLSSELDRSGPADCSELKLRGNEAVVVHLDQS
jgi:alpha-glucosidase